MDLDAFDEEVKQCLKENKSMIQREKSRRIHPQTYCCYNSVNILCGPQDSGKTFTAITEIAKISRLSPETHLCVIVCKNETIDDSTVESLKPLVKIPIVYVAEQNAEEYVKRLLKYKQFYNDIVENGWADQIEDDQAEEVVNVLKIDDFSRPWLHTILVFNDVAKSKLFNKSTNYFNQLVPVCRHIQCSFFLNVQFWKSLPPEIKENTTIMFIFGGFSRQQLQYIVRQTPTKYSFEDIHTRYKTLRKHDKLIFNRDNGELSYERKSE